MDEDETPRKNNSHINYLITPLEKDGIVTKQQYAYRYKDKPRHQVLILLKRFHRDLRTRHKILSERIIEILRNAPGYIMSMTEVKYKLAEHIGVQRLNDDLFKKVYQNLKNRLVELNVQNIQWVPLCPNFLEHFCWASV